MFKKLLLKKMMERQLSGVPEEERAMLLAAVEKDPDFFMRLAAEVEEKTKSGMSQMDAARRVFETHGDELRRLLGR